MEEPRSRLTDLLAHIDELTIQVSSLADGPKKKKLLSELDEIRVRFGLPTPVQEPSLAASPAHPDDNAPTRTPTRL